MEIRHCQRSDLNALKALFQQVYPSNLLLQDDAFLEWQFRDHPWNDNGEFSLLLAIDESNGIKGTYGYVPARYWVDGVSMEGCEPALWWTAPSYGVCGLALYDRVVQRQSVQVYMDCNKKSLAVFSRLGIPFLSLPRLVGILDAGEVHRLFPDTDPNVLSRCQLALERPSIEIAVAELTGVLDGANGSALRTYNIRGHLDFSAEYLNWRYREIPGHDYKIVRTGANDFAVFRIEPVLNHNSTVIRIVDWCVGPENDRAVLSLIAQIGLASETILMDFSCTSKTLRARLASIGLFEVDKTPSFQNISRWFRPINKAPPFTCALGVKTFPGETLDMFGWYITMGNGDADRLKN